VVNYCISASDITYRTGPYIDMWLQGGKHTGLGFVCSNVRINAAPGNNTGYRCYDPGHDIGRRCLRQLRGSGTLDQLEQGSAWSGPGGLRFPTHQSGVSRHRCVPARDILGSGHVPRAWHNGSGPGTPLLLQH